jgi:hypothetical protein
MPADLGGTPSHFRVPSLFAVLPILLIKSNYEIEISIIKPIAHLVLERARK